MPCLTQCVWARVRLADIIYTVILKIYNVMCYLHCTRCVVIMTLNGSGGGNAARYRWICWIPVCKESRIVTNYNTLRTF